MRHLLARLPKPARLPKVMLWAAFMILFWIVFSFLDPLSFERATRDASATFFMNLTAPFYGLKHPAQSKIAVVEITDTTLDTWGETWPLPYDRMANIVQTIIEAGAAGVMVDIRFARERAGQSLSAFAEPIELARQRNIPLLFSRGQAGDDYEDLPAPLTDHATITGWQSQNGTSADIYPLWVHPSGERTGQDHPPVPTASFDLFRQLCATHTLAACPEDLGPEAFERNLVIRWGTHTDPQQAGWVDRKGQPQSCYDVGDTALTRLRTAVWRTYKSLSTRLQPAQARQNCYYHLTIPAEDLYRADDNGNPVADKLAGRVVFLGAELRGDNDVVSVPVLGQVPGVHVHSMAFDNLLTYGADYFSEPGEVHLTGQASAKISELVELLCWTIAVIVSAASQLRTVSDRKSRWLIWSIRAAVAGTALCGAIDLWRFHDGARTLTIALYTVLALTLTLALVCKSATGAVKKLHPVWHWLSRLFLIVSFVALAFACNEALLRWPTSDWIGLILVWLALGEARDIFELGKESGAREQLKLDRANAA